MTQKRNTKMADITTIWPKPNVTNASDSFIDCGEISMVAAAPTDTDAPKKPEIPSIPDDQTVRGFTSNTKLADNGTIEPDFSILRTATISIVTPDGTSCDVLESFISSKSRKLPPAQRDTLHYDFHVMVDVLVEPYTGHNSYSLGHFYLRTECGLAIRGEGEFRCLLMAIATGRRQLGTDFCGNPSIVLRFEAEEHKKHHKDFNTELAEVQRDVDSMAAGLGLANLGPAPKDQIKKKNNTGFGAAHIDGPAQFVSSGLHGPATTGKTAAELSVAEKLHNLNAIKEVMRRSEAQSDLDRYNMYLETLEEDDTDVAEFTYGMSANGQAPALRAYRDMTLGGKDRAYPMGCEAAESKHGYPTLEEYNGYQRKQAMRPSSSRKDSDHKAKKSAYSFW